MIVLSHIYPNKNKINHQKPLPFHCLRYDGEINEYKLKQQCKGAKIYCDIDNKLDLQTCLL